MWVCNHTPRPIWAGWVVHIGRGFRLLFYFIRACEGLKEREEQTDFTLFVYID